MKLSVVWEMPPAVVVKAREERPVAGLKVVVQLPLPSMVATKYYTISLGNFDSEVSVKYLTER
jgi:hypothetical protein